MVARTRGGAIRATHEPVRAPVIGRTDGGPAHPVSQPLSISSASGRSRRVVLNARPQWIVSLPSQSPK